MKLTQANMSRLALPKGKAEAIFFDSDLAGFGLRLREGGSSTWVFQYKLGIAQRRISFGKYPALDAVKARAKAQEFHARVKLGQDPASDKADAIKRAAETVGAIVERFLSYQRGRLKPKSYDQVQRHLLANAKPLHRVAIDTIDRRAISLWLSDLVSTNGPAQANRARASLSAMLAWAIREGLANDNAAAFTNKAAENPPRDRVLTNAELTKIWNACEDDDYGQIVRLLALTGQRKTEIADLGWSEIDLEQGVVVLPRERTKNKRQHSVPLSAAAAAILESKTVTRDPERDLVFGRGTGGFSGWSRAKRDFDKRAQVSNWTLHDLRRTCATGMADLGVQPHIIEAVLNHVSGHKAGVAGIYNRSSYETEKRRALDLWDQHVLAVVESRKSKVVALRERA